MNCGAFLVVLNLSCVPADGLIHVWFAAYEVGKLRNVVFRLHIVDSIGLRIVYVGTGLFHTHFVAITTIAICSRSTHWNLPRSIFFRMTWTKYPYKKISFLHGCMHLMTAIITQRNQNNAHTLALVSRPMHDIMHIVLNNSYKHWISTHLKTIYENNLIYWTLNRYSWNCES